MLTLSSIVAALPKRKGVSLSKEGSCRSADTLEQHITALVLSSSSCATCDCSHTPLSDVPGTSDFRSPANTILGPHSLSVLQHFTVLDDNMLLLMACHARTGRWTISVPKLNDYIHSSYVLQRND